MVHRLMLKTGQRQQSQDIHGCLLALPLPGRHLCHRPELGRAAQSRIKKRGEPTWHGLWGPQARVFDRVLSQSAPKKRSGGWHGHISHDFHWPMLCSRGEQDMASGWGGQARLSQGFAPAGSQPVVLKRQNVWLLLWILGRETSLAAVLRGGCRREASPDPGKPWKCLAKP